jgi:hypothetical protein
VLKVVKKAATAETPNFEFMAANGVLHISLFYPDKEMNLECRAEQRHQTVVTPLPEVRPYQLSIATPGYIDSVVLKVTEMSEGAPQKEFVKVSVQAICLTSRVNDEDENTKKFGDLDLIPSDFEANGM